MTHLPPIHEHAYSCTLWAVNVGTTISLPTPLLSYEFRIVGNDPEITGVLRDEGRVLVEIHTEWSQFTCPAGPSAATGEQMHIYTTFLQEKQKVAGKLECIK